MGAWANQKAAKHQKGLLPAVTGCHDLVQGVSGPPNYNDHSVISAEI